MTLRTITNAIELRQSEYDGSVALRISGKRFNADDLEKLSAWPIQELSLDGDWINADVLQAVSNIHSLNALLLDACTVVDDVGIAHLLDLRNLTSLSLRWCDITDKSCEVFADLNLVDLFLEGCEALTNAGLAKIGQSSTLINLSLPGFSAIDDEGLSLLVDAQTPLKYLAMNNETNVSDVGIARLCGLRTLERIYIANTPRITNFGLEELSRCLPDIEVIK